MKTIARILATMAIAWITIFAVGSLVLIPIGNPAGFATCFVGGASVLIFAWVSIFVLWDIK